MTFSVTRIRSLKKINTIDFCITSEENSSRIINWVLIFSISMHLLHRILKLNPQ